MAFGVSTGRLGIQDLQTATTTQNHAIGDTVNGIDPTLGGGEFIYLRGVTSTVAGSVVTYQASNGQTALAPNTANLGQPVAVAMSACTTGLFGWYQIGGVATCKKTAVAVAPNSAIHISGTAGRVMPTAASGKQILGARSANAASVTTTTSTVLVQLSRPHLQGRIT